MRCAVWTQVLWQLLPLLLWDLLQKLCCLRRLPHHPVVLQYAENHALKNSIQKKVQEYIDLQSSENAWKVMLAKDRSN